MLIKKYKTLKSISTLSNLSIIIKNSSFFCIVQVKHLNHNEWFELKKIIYPLGLNIFVCKNTLLKSKNAILNLPKHLMNNLSHGKSAILYSTRNLFSSLTNSFFATDLFLRKVKMSPLIFYFLGRFLLPKDFFNVYKTSKHDAFCNLISILQYHSYDIPNKLTSSNKLLLINLNHKRL